MRVSLGLEYQQTKIGFFSLKLGLDNIACLRTPLFAFSLSKLKLVNFREVILFSFSQFYAIWNNEGRKWIKIKTSPLHMIKLLKRERSLFILYNNLLLKSIMRLVIIYGLRRLKWVWTIHVVHILPIFMWMDSSLSSFNPEKSTCIPSFLRYASIERIIFTSIIDIRPFSRLVHKFSYFSKRRVWACFEDSQ